MTARESAWVVERQHYLPDYRRAFDRRGFATETVPAEEILARLARPGPRPAFVVDSTPLSPLHPALREAGVPIVNLPFDQWYFSPRITLPPCEPLRAEHLVFTLAPEQVAPFRAAGYAHVEHLLFGVDPEHFDDRPPDDGDGDHRYRAEVCFVGSSLRGHEPVDSFTQAVRRSPHNAGLRDFLAQILARVVPFDYHLPDILLAMEAEAGASIGETPGLTPAKETWCILGGIKLSELERLEVVRTLARFDLALYGPPDWREQLAGDPALRCYRGELDWATALPRAIRGAALSVNVSKAMFPTGICPRIFETLACGRLLLTNPIPAVLEAFQENEEIVVYRSCAELADKVRHYLAHPQEAARIGERARAAIVARHSVQARVDRIVAVLEERGIVRPAPSA